MSATRPGRALVLPLAALSILLPGLAACGGSDASSGGTGTAASGGGRSTAKADDRYLAYARCMRRNGVPDWPDPIDGTKFLMPRGKVNPETPEFKAAEKACESVRPPGWHSGGRQDPDAQAKMLKYAQCMRQNGLSQFPDPQNGRLDIGDLDPESPQFKAAEQKCRSLRPAGAGG
ncbi:hypothetical protein Acsp04_56260 [Actinomadura sp. NBRC 104425]|uniref:hypothetical protein n=1 Tax=Actinomadura sp. NBRC 104425 TaxID=3032204 RepID=UPI0024A4A03B|nr:hypothetical protein [Actinomadura sp. NBRC 104425]GLZ15391.1 hypothetical protein Acsp04_56260 [Actinomadura sp. NBRC 104425]